MKVVKLNILITTLAIACSPKGIASLDSPKTDSYKWGYEYYPTKSESDSLNMSFISLGLETDKNCFPSDFVDNDSFSFSKVMVFNRWGQVQFQTTRLDSNWICNDQKNENFIPGTYYYRFEYTLMSNSPDSIQSIQDPIYIIKKSETSE